MSESNHLIKTQFLEMFQLLLSVINYFHIQFLRVVDVGLSFNTLSFW